MKILVTGGSGFVGQAYLRRMEAKGHECINYDLPDHNIMDTVNLRIQIKRVDMVVHFAAVADLYISMADQERNFDINVKGTFNIARICADEGKPLIYISTCCAYGNSLDDVETEDKTKPQCMEPYATAKVAGEYILMGMPNLKYCTLRIGTVYGVGQRESLFTFIALDKVKRGEKIYIHGDGKQSRQLIYITDLIDGIELATVKFNELPNGEIINICGSEKISALLTVATAEVLIGKQAIKEHVDQRYGQTFVENISIDKAKNLLEWEPITTFLWGMDYTYKNDPRFK